MGALLDFLIQGVINYIHIEYFLSLLFLTEFVKMATYYSPKTKYHIFKFDKKGKFRFRSKFLAFFMGIIIATSIYLTSLTGIFEDDMSLLRKLVLTFAVTTSFYELFFFLLVDKFKEILKTLIKAEIKPIKIDLNNTDFGSDISYADDVYIDYSTNSNSVKKKGNKNKNKEVEQNDESF